MSSTNRGAERRPNDFYETPAWVVDAIIRHIPVAGADSAPDMYEQTVLDAGAGRGAIALRMLAAGYHHVSGIEIDSANVDACVAAGVHCERADFLATPLGRVGPEIVVMNPPFSHAEAFVRHALHLVSGHEYGQVFALLRLAFLEGQVRAPFHRQFPSDVFVLPRRPSFTGGGTDSSAYAWFAWGPCRGGRWSIFEVPK